MSHHFFDAVGRIEKSRLLARVYAPANFRNYRDFDAMTINSLQNSNGDLNSCSDTSFV